MYDIKDGQVTLFAKPVGPLESESVKQALREALASDFPMSAALKKVIFKVAVDPNCCPGCGGAYIEKSRANGIGMGFCIACGDALFQFKGAVKMQFHPDRPGWKRFRNILAIEPAAPAEPVKASSLEHLMY